MINDINGVNQALRYVFRKADNYIEDVEITDKPFTEFFSSDGEESLEMMEERKRLFERLNTFLEIYNFGKNQNQQDTLSVARSRMSNIGGRTSRSKGSFVTLKSINLENKKTDGSEKGFARASKFAKMSLNVIKS